LNASLKVGFGAVGERDLVLARARAQTVLDDHDVIATVFCETVL
jgi:hypothetical protein